MPRRAEIAKVSQLAPLVKLFTLSTEENHHAKPGQFFMVSAMGSGEIPISVASGVGEEITLCIRKVGKVTAAIHALKEGDTLGIRGPYGNGFSLEHAKGKDVIIIAGGIGIAPLRPLIREIGADRKSYGRLMVLYGAKTPGDMIFRDEMESWCRPASILLTVDRADKKWEGRTGMVTRLLEEIQEDLSEAAAFVCGPEVMIRATMEKLSLWGVLEERIVTTLEAHMKCGVGKCGHCYIGGKFLCTDGPVFSLKDLRDIREAALRRTTSPAS